MQKTRYIFGSQINNVYFCINEKAMSISLTPHGKKKNEMREHCTDYQQDGAQNPFMSLPCKFSRKNYFSNTL
jgi:hypothetical protein